MSKLQAFKETLEEVSPAGGWPVQLQSLWYDGQGDWNTAHALIDQLSDPQSAWVHAYLHRKEGDIWNADYWYARARKPRPELSLAEEWEQLVIHFSQS